ncbi:carboxypeptidase regulatory-like domain-containing protein [Paraburkholderia guartelaensis]|uniref:Carboxypeptidase regulatory-like domain-containing protein n=1 Tax=Paraburkholderia guartelaensis TaxID=2546446 RepID=A0A4V2ZVL4_9BURK|nr:carboxypeptidase regulatory-like domain-containing protein [Paraburkholderia guartelaensis]TDG05668.1 carboxypeptidase regulatory-like domain-containing protein [Paraburkholderia guartelaensis]
MKARSTPWIGAALALAVVFGAPLAWAATPAAGNASVTSATAGVLPPAQHKGDIAYLSGGIGSDQSAAFKSAMHQYPLSLEFARQAAGGNEYLANVPVKIADMHGTPLLSTRTRGPFMLVSIPDGRYIVTASHGGNTERRTVDIGKTTRAHETFVWPM